MNERMRLEGLAEALRDWVDRERANAEETGVRPSQVYFRRARISMYLAEADFWESIDELDVIAKEKR